jgi:intein/homing endonuclease
MLKEDILAKEVAARGMNAVAITDHGNMFNVAKFYKACKREKVKPIIGMETYVAPRLNTLKEAGVDNANYHLVLLCENNEGYQNLINISSDASLNGFYYRARTDKEKLREWHKGLIALSACLGGEVQKLLLNDDYEKAKAIALEYQDIFGKGKFYLELQNHGLHEQAIVNEKLIKMSRETGIPVVATNDCHYLNNIDSKAHDVLMAIQAKTTIYDEKRKVYTSDQFYLKTPEEMEKLFGHIPEALENTVKIAEQCNVEIDFESSKLPPFQLPSDFEGTNLDFLRNLVYEGIESLYGEITDELKERAEYEMGVIDRMGFVNYFLINWDFFRFCRTGSDEIGKPGPEDWEEILTGPGRGCFVPGTKILLDSGYVKNIEDIVVGDSVITHTGEALEVTNTFEYDCDEEISVIKACNEELRCTSDHEILVVKPSKCFKTGNKDVSSCRPSCPKSETCKKERYSKYSEEWVPAREIVPGDYVVFPEIKRSNKEIIFDMSKFADSNYNVGEEYIWRRSDKKIKRYVKLDENLAKLLGYYISEGCSEINEDKRKYRVGFGFNKRETDYADDVVDLVGACFGIKEVTIVGHKTRNSMQVIVYNKIIARFFSELCNRYSRNVSIPDIVFREANDDILKVLISYMFRGDGSRLRKEKYNRIKYSTTSQNLASQLRAVLAKLGYWASIKVRGKRVSHPNWRKEYSVLLSGKQLNAWNRDFYGFQIEHKQAQFSRNDGFYTRNGRIYIKVAGVSAEKYCGKVYDISVPPNKSYIANSMCVHNSGAGSIVLYALGVTKIDPIKYELLFERFLDPSRISMPDVDSDFERDRRQEVIDYVVRKYGRQSVCQIVTYGTLAARAAIRAVGRALDMPYGVYDHMAKLVPAEPGITLADALEDSPDFKKKYEIDDDIKYLIDTATKLEGLPIYTGTHAAGVLITDQKGVTAHVPVWDNDGAIVSQYDMKLLEDLGLLKMDFLGLKTLTVIKDAMKSIKQNHGVSVNLDELIKCEDPAPLQLLEEGKTQGLFQIEGTSMTEFIKELKPKNPEEWIAAISLYRPGPMQFIPEYLKNRRNPESINYVFPELKNSLEETYGILCYQEQCMRAVIDVAGYDKSDSDSFRKVIAKKNKELIPLHRKWFIEGRKRVSPDEYGKEKDYGHEIPGGLSKGYSEDDLKEFFDHMEDFGKYA